MPQLDAPSCLLRNIFYIHVDVFDFEVLVGITRTMYVYRNEESNS